MRPIDQFKEMQISWVKHPTNERYYYTRIDNDIILLRLNDFPDEPLLTLIYGLDILDVEEVPQNWKVPFS
jgi:hypothetical protein